MAACLVLLPRVISILPPSHSIHLWEKTGKNMTQLSILTSMSKKVLIGFERERSKWAQVASSIPIQGMGTGEATYVPEGEFPKIQMKKGEHKSVYISMTDREEMRYTAVMQEMGEVYSEDKNMQILVGSGNSYDQHGFGEFYPKRMWNGRIMYEKVQAEARMMTSHKWRRAPGSWFSQFKASDIVVSSTNGY